jgi:hypothetical protein
MTYYMLKRKIESNVIAMAKELTPNGAYNKRSITEGERNVIGTIGELYVVDILHKLFGMDQIKYEPNYNFDVFISNTRKIDIKTKMRTVEPKGRYAASIVEYSIDLQHCDDYFFTNIKVDNLTDMNPQYFYFMGYITKANFLANAVFKRKGDRDGNNRKPNGEFFTIKEDCRNLDYDRLKIIDLDLVKERLPKYEIFMG